MRHQTRAIGLVILTALLAAACAVNPSATPSVTLSPTPGAPSSTATVAGQGATPAPGVVEGFSARTEVVNLSDNPIAVLASVFDPSDNSFHAAGVADIEPGGIAQQSVPPATYRLEFVEVDGTDMTTTPAPSILSTIGSCTFAAQAGDLYQFAFAGGVGVVVRNDQAPPTGTPMEIGRSPLCRAGGPAPSTAPASGEPAAVQQ